MVPILCPVAGISGNEFIVLILVAVIVVGPQRLPEYTRKLTQLIRQLRVFLDNAKTQIAEEVGPELGDLNLADLDPRNYDPRKIVRDALGEDLDAIRRDLTTPIKAVTDAAKESSREAVRSVTEVVRKEQTDTLSKRIEGIEDKAVQGEQSALPANNEPSPDAKAPESASQTGQSSAPDHAQDPQEGATTESPQEGAAEDGRLQDEPAGAEGDSARRSSEPVGASAGDGDHDSAKAAHAPDEPAADGKSADGEPTDAAAVAAASRAAAAAVPSSLAKAPAASDAALARPVSPREIVRAANAAARTRAEAATVTVDA